MKRLAAAFRVAPALLTLAACSLHRLPEPSIPSCPTEGVASSLWHCLDGIPRDDRPESGFTSTFRVSDTSRKQRDQSLPSACEGPTPPGFELRRVDMDAGRAPLVALVAPPSDASSPIVIVVHGLFDSKYTRYVEVTGELFQRQGFGVVLPDMRCHGCLLSRQWLPTLGVEEGADLLAWGRWLAREHPGHPIGLVGFSLGGLDVLHAMGQPGADEVFTAGAVAVSPAADLPRLVQYLDAKVFFADAGFSKSFRTGFRSLLRKRAKELGMTAEGSFAGTVEFLVSERPELGPTPAEFLDRADPSRSVATSRRPLLILVRPTTRSSPCHPSTSSAARRTATPSCTRSRRLTADTSASPVTRRSGSRRSSRPSSATRRPRPRQSRPRLELGTVRRRGVGWSCAITRWSTGGFPVPLLLFDASLQGAQGNSVRPRRRACPLGPSEAPTVGAFPRKEAVMSSSSVSRLLCNRFGFTLSAVIASVVFSGSAARAADEWISSSPAPAWGTAHSSVLTLTAADFGSMDEAQVTAISDEGSRSCIELPSEGSECKVMAGVSLPSGALIEYVEFAVCDFDLLDGAEAFLYAREGFEGGPAIASITTQGFGGCSLWTSGFVGVTVVNLSTTYTVRVNLPVSFLGVGFRAVRIFYSLQVSPTPGFASFNDVPTSHPLFQYVEALYASGITAGCGGGNFCPGMAVTRGQMAVFLAKALGLFFPN